MLCVGEFPMPPEAEGIKSTSDNLSEATITPGHRRRNRRRATNSDALPGKDDLGGR